MALIPRQSPQMPPMLEKKSNHVIFFDLSNSKKKIWSTSTSLVLILLLFSLTKNCWFSKEDVNNSDIPVICIVHRVSLKILQLTTTIMTTASRRITSTILWCSLYTYPCPEIQPNAMQSNLLIAPLCYFRLRDVIMMKMLTSAREERISLVAMEPGYSLIKNVDLLNDILKQVKHIWNLFQWYSDKKCVDP